MIYKNLSFRIPQKRPFFYSSFVTTLDGKIFIRKPGYWPIGSKTDYDTFTYLRAHADVIIDGKQTALAFGEKTIETIHKPSFLKLRKRLGKTNPIEYCILTKNPSSIASLFINPYGYKPTIASCIDLKNLALDLKKKKHKNIFIDGGPTLLRSFIEEDLLDELFLTISPKVYGGKPNDFLTMIEGELFSAGNIPTFNLLSAKQKNNEIYLRYKRDSKTSLPVGRQVQNDNKKD